MTSAVDGDDHEGVSGHRVASLPPEPATDPDSGPVFVAGHPPMRSVRRALLVRDGPVAGLRFELRAGLTTVGRSGQADFPLHDEAISRRHFELEATPSGVELRDLGSGNGTRVNGRRVERAFLRNGDRIVAGNSTLEFHEAAAASTGQQDSLPPDIPRGRRGWQLGLAIGLPGLLALALLSGIVVRRRQAQQRTAEEAFERGEAELAEDPPDPDLALADFLAAQRDYPDHRALRDAIAQAQTTARAIQQFALARELSDRRDFAAARRQLQGLPAGDYFARMARAIGEEIDQREAHPLATPHPPIPVIRRLPVPRKQPGEAETDDDRAEQLCDEADALLGPNAEAAHQKYREALELARPGGEAARRAQGGLSN